MYIFQNPSHMARWTNTLYNWSKENGQLITSHAITPEQLMQIAIQYHENIELDNADVQKIIKLYKQIRENDNPKAYKQLGYESNFTAVPNDDIISKTNKEAFTQGAMFYKADTIKPKIKQFIQQQLTGVTQHA